MSEFELHSKGSHTTELSANFYTHFQAKKNSISARLEALDTSGSTSNTPTTELNSISSDIVTLRKDLVDATPFLPSYDQRKCEQQLKVLEEALSRRRAPKSKFAFKRKTVTPASLPSPSLPSRPSNIPPPVVLAKSPAILSTTHLTLSSQSTTLLTLSSLIPPVHASPSPNPGIHHRSSDITLTDLRDCIVNLFPSTAPEGASDETRTRLTITALHAKSLHRVVLLIPPIEGSVLLHDIQSSIVVVGCHQFRMHDSTNTIVLLHGLSNPIIERSQRIRFGAYPHVLQYASSQSFSERPSKHALVQDFDWIKPSPSPNWSLLDLSSDIGGKMVHIANSVTDQDEVLPILTTILPRE